jgi:hypothetical protein
VAARLGEHDTSTDSETLHVDVNILKTIEHPNYDRRDGTSDLAVVYLRQSIQFNGEFLFISNDENQSKVFSVQILLDQFVYQLLSLSKQRTMNTTNHMSLVGVLHRKMEKPLLFCKTWRLQFFRIPYAPTIIELSTSW